MDQLKSVNVKTEQRAKHTHTRKTKVTSLEKKNKEGKVINEGERMESPG